MQNCTIIVNFIWNNMELEDFAMLRNINISEYFDMVRHVMKLNKELWERNGILSNMEEGFKMIKCTSRIDCNEIAVALTKI